MHSEASQRKYPLRGQFSGVSRDIWHETQPLYYLEAIGMDGIKLRPFAKVKIGSSYMRLYIDLGDALRKTSKNKRHKVLRYGKGWATDTQANITEIIGLAVRDYLNH